jgi:alkaline phosphatase D
VTQRFWAKNNGNGWKASCKNRPDIRLIGSSTQFSISYNGYEAWANVPHERQRMLDLIKTTKANGVLFMSGDVHYAEISKIANPGAYPHIRFNSQRPFVYLAFCDPQF